MKPLTKKYQCHFNFHVNFMRLYSGWGGLNKDVRERVRSVIEMLQQSCIYLSNVFLETLCRVIIFIIISSIVHNLSSRKSRPYLRNIFAAHRQYNYWPLIRIHPCKKIESRKIDNLYLDR